MPRALVAVAVGVFNIRMAASSTRKNKTGVIEDGIHQLACIFSTRLCSSIFEEEELKVQAEKTETSRRFPESFA